MASSPGAAKIRRLQLALEQTEARRQAILESALDCIICTDASGRITDFNAAAERTFRMTRSIAIGKDLVDSVFPAELRDSHRRELLSDTALDGMDVLGNRLETLAVRANGNKFPAEVTVTCFAIKRKSTFTVTVRDLTARKKAEETLVRLAAIVESSQDAIISIDLEGQITSCNQGAELMFGYSDHEVVGKSLSILIPEDCAGHVPRCLGDLRAGNCINNFETVCLTKEGKRLDMSLTTSCIPDSDGVTVGGSIIGRDITARKLTEEALRKANETSVYGSPIPILAGDTVGNITMWNSAAERVFGWTEAEVRGKPNPIIPPEECDSAENLRLRMLSGETLTGIEVRRQKRDGTRVDMSLCATCLRDKDNKVRGTIGFLTDITERKRAERSLREAEEKYRSIFENAVEGIYQTSPQGKYLSANPALARMLGFNSPEELIEARSDLRRLEYVEPEKRDEFLSLMNTYGEVHNFEYQVHHKSGKTIWVSENAHAVKDAEGNILYYEGTVEDTTRQRELEEQLRQMQKIEAIGRLAGGVAHDFNNILMAISSYAELLYKKLPEKDNTRRYVDEIVHATDRGSFLTQSLLAFSRKQVLLPRVIDLNTLVAEQINMLERLLGEHITLRFEPDKNLGHVKVDPGQIEQVVMNLVINARDAMPNGGEVLIETANAELDQAASEGNSPAASGHYVVLAVSDTGCGMDTETKSHIFEPFFTTKEQGKGTGLGLATVFGIVKQSDGQIFLRSEPGFGTTFKVYLPQVEDAVNSTAQEAQPSPIRGRETILLVEDEAAVRESAAEYLSGNGYTILKAKKGSEAIEIASQYGGSIHLLLTDVVMPQMSGKELSERFGRIHPKAKIVFMSGYSNHFLSNQQAVDQVHTLLQKPFRLATLGQRIREVLNEVDDATAAS
jgi:PAS domain S-box-containing protein